MMKIADIILESDYNNWDPDNVVPCARCGQDIDFNKYDDCTNPDCGATADEYTRGSSGQTR